MFFWKKQRFWINAFLKKAKHFDPFETKAYVPLVSVCKEEAGEVEQKHFGLRLIVISDTHGDLAFGDNFRHFIDGAGEYDLCVILGDIYVYELDKITEYVPVEKIIALRGNHDCFDVYDKHGIKNINGEIFTYKGVRFAGIEGSFKYKKEEFPSYTHYESLALAYKMPKEADVLLSHDRMFESDNYDKAHSGLFGITYNIFKNQVKWHIHGHIHESYMCFLENGTIEKSIYGCEIVEI